VLAGLLEQVNRFGLEQFAHFVAMANENQMQGEPQNQHQVRLQNNLGAGHQMIHLPNPIGLG
jgi:hypothetical protein